MKPASAGRLLRRTAFGTALLALAGTAQPFGTAVDAPVNYIEVKPTITTAGMPTRSQLNRLAGRHAAVINLVPSDGFGSHPDEREIVEGAGARYVHLPVDWAAPTAADYLRFAAEMRALSDRKVFVHCQMNMRASVFVFLYRTVELREDADRAYDEVLRVWEPNAVWSRFARDVLKAHDLAPPLGLSEHR